MRIVSSWQRESNWFHWSMIVLRVQACKKMFSLARLDRLVRLVRLIHILNLQTDNFYIYFFVNKTEKRQTSISTMSKRQMDQGKLLGHPFPVFCLMSPCLHVCLYVFMYVSWSSCLVVTMSPCHNVSKSPCLHVSMSPCLHVSMSPWPCLHNGKQNSPKTATTVCFLQTENGNGKLPFVCCKRKQKTNICLPWSANDKWYRRLLFQQTNGAIYE